MLEANKKRFAILSYRTKLGQFLTSRHGKQAVYTTEQVRQGASDLGLDLLLICYAFAMFCTRETFNSHHAASARHCDYDSMRNEIAGLELATPSSFDSDGDELDPSDPDLDVDCELPP